MSGKAAAGTVSNRVTCCGNNRALIVGIGDMRRIGGPKKAVNGTPFSSTVFQELYAVLGLHCQVFA
jgi:hypothetical protein